MCIVYLNVGVIPLYFILKTTLVRISKLFSRERVCPDEKLTKVRVGYNNVVWTVAIISVPCSLVYLGIVIVARADCPLKKQTKNKQTFPFKFQIQTNLINSNPLSREKQVKLLQNYVSPAHKHSYIPSPWVRWGCTSWLSLGRPIRSAAPGSCGAGYCRKPNKRVK